MLITLLAGCASIPKVETANVMVPVPCVISIPEKPDYSVFRPAKEDNIFDLVKKLLAEIKERKAYELQLETEALSCQ